MTRIRVMAKGFAAAVLTSAIIHSASAQTTWDMPSIYPATSFHVVNVMNVYADEVRKATSGQVQIRVHPGGALGIAGNEMIAAVRDGIVKIADLSLNLSSGYEPILSLEGLPLLVSNYEELAILQKHFRPKVDEIAKKYNQKILTMVPWPPQYLHLKKPVTKVEELKGVKIRASTKNEVEVFGGIGLAPIQLPWGEVVPALAAGTIEGVVTSTSSGVDGKFWEFLKIAYPTSHTWNSQVITVNLNAWNSLKPEQQKAMQDIADRLQPKFWERSKAEDKERGNLLTQHGYTVSRELPAGLGDALRKSSATIIKAYMDKTPGAREIIEAYFKDVGRPQL
jgi:TRAP-type C4-dicarboxylate transport system substrate-binding protein